MMNWTNEAVQAEATYRRFLADERSFAVFALSLAPTQRDRRAVIVGPRHFQDVALALASMESQHEGALHLQ